jgi:predicted NBD/HSP70 family sugar kinase
MTLLSSIILNLKKKPMSLADIQQFTDTSLPTVRRAVQALSNSRWIRIVGQAEANGGRPAMLYGIDDSYFMVLGCHLQLPGIQLIAADLNSKVIKKINLFQNEIPDPNTVVRALVDSANDLISQFEGRQTLGLGIASPGFFDQSTGDIIAIGRVPSWKNFPICRHLSEAIGLPVQIANDVDCMAIAEFDEDRLLNKNLVYIGYCEGVKASLFLDGKLYKGSLGNVGLIYSAFLNFGENKNEIDYDQLLHVTGVIHSFEQRVNELTPLNQEKYQTINDLTKDREKFYAILSKAAEHDEVCFPLIQELIRVISIPIANIIHIIQPDEIVIGGLLGALPKELFLDLENLIRSSIPLLVSNNLIIKKGLIEPTNNAAIGAIQHFLNIKLSEILGEI